MSEYKDIACQLAIHGSRVMFGGEYTAIGYQLRFRKDCIDLAMKLEKEESQRAGQIMAEAKVWPSMGPTDPIIMCSEEAKKFYIEQWNQFCDEINGANHDINTLMDPIMKDGKRHLGEKELRQMMQYLTIMTDECEKMKDAVSIIRKETRKNEK